MDCQCTGFTSISTTYVSETHKISSYRVFETCSCLFVSSDMLKCRSLKLLSDHPMIHVFERSESGQDQGLERFIECSRVLVCSMIYVYTAY